MLYELVQHSDMGPSRSVGSFRWSVALGITDIRVDSPEALETIEGIKNKGRIEVVQDAGGGDAWVYHLSDIGEQDPGFIGALKGRLASIGVEVRP